MMKDEAKQKVGELVAKYESLSPAEVKKFNEANTKLAFILPLFAALGWDIFDTNEVALEEAASNKRVDFAFKINNVARFYVEAKPLKADLNNLEYVKQAITYAYNNGVTWAILTNFEELRLFNAQLSKPFIQLNCKDFNTSFDKLWLLSRDAIANDGLNKEATQYGALPLAIPIEENLFKQLRQWRESLFNELYHYNSEWLKEKQIDEVIQKLFNRLIFIRTAEDRGLEEKKLLAASHQHKHGLPLSYLQEIFQYYRGYYDSDLFETHILDGDRLYIQETTLTEILNGLYEIPSGIANYDFSVISADVLGRVYEQYLGYVASAVKEKAKAIQAKLDLGLKADTEFEVTAKKQRRKAQGIYYTPQFVTDFIVKETVGRFIKENEAAGYDKILKMKILDPACGSGSFLIRAYDELLNYHAKVRGKDANKLEQPERMSILTRNIFGVDLDIQAVEIARLNLLLRSLAKRAPIEPIKDNICQGNSLISGTEKELKSYFGKDWQAKHPFNWQDEFKDIMASGGFDVVIGNPPYGIVFDTNMKAYLEHKYPVFRRNYDFFVAFIQKGLQVLKNGGFFSFILPNTFLGGQYFEDLREYIFSEAKILKIVDFGISRVFLEPNVFNVIILLQKESEAPKRKNNTVMLVNGLSITPNDSQVDFTTEPRIQSRLPSLGWRSIDPIVRKCIDKHLKLVDMAYVKDVGLNYWTIGRKKTRGGSIADRILYEGERKNKQDLPYLKGRDTERYYYAFNDRWLRHNYQEFLVPEVDIFGYGSDFLLNGSKIIYRQTADSIVATIDNHPYLVDKTLHAVRIKDASAKDFSLEYLLGILNSKLATYVYRDFAKEEGRLFAQVKTFIMKELPIRQIDFTNQSEKQAHDNIVAHVEKILELNKKLAPIREIYSDEREELLKEIAKTDKEIDSLVYDLYGLTEAEIKIVEANA